MRRAIITFLFLFMPLSFVIADNSDDSVCLFAVPKIAFKMPEITMAKAKEVSLNTLKAIPGKADILSAVLADKLDAAKISNTPVSEPQDQGKIAGVNTTNPYGNLIASAYNTGIDTLGILLRNWMWTLSGLLALGLFWTFKS